jgi:Calcineurin-like phosphoesterase
MIQSTIDDRRMKKCVTEERSDVVVGDKSERTSPIYRCNMVCAWPSKFVMKYPYPEIQNQNNWSIPLLSRKLWFRMTGFRFSIAFCGSNCKRPASNTNSTMKTDVAHPLLVIGAAVCIRAVGAQQQQPANVSIVHINDHHSHIEQLTMDLPPIMFPAAVNESLPNATFIRMKYGSFPRVVSLIKQLSNQATDDGFNVLRLHAGDAVTGTIYYSIFKSAVDSAVLNLAGFDAMTIGNHEFDDVSTSAVIQWTRNLVGSWCSLVCRETRNLPTSSRT